MFYLFFSSLSSRQRSLERGAVKHMYCMRKPFWEKVSELVSSGYSATVACDKVYEAYEPCLPATHILRKMKAD